MKISLTKKLAEANRNLDYWKENCTQLKDKNYDLDKANQRLIDENSYLKRQLEEVNVGSRRDYLEIVRWLANRDTANFPFQTEKHQRDEGRSFNGRY